MTIRTDAEEHLELPVQSFSWYPSWPTPVRARLLELDEGACSYLPSRKSRLRGFLASSIDERSYEELLNSGFRRSGRFIYQPACAGCRECKPIRVLVNSFTASKSQRRVWKRNSDLLIEVAAPRLSDEKVELYNAYIRDWHHDSASGATSSEQLRSFLYDSPVTSVEFSYRDPRDRKLLAVGICDLTPSVLSSVYFYFSPFHWRRGLGTFGALQEIRFARELGKEWYHIGYLVRECASMRYKSMFRPFETLGTDGAWRSDGRDGESGGQEAYGGDRRFPVSCTADSGLDSESDVNSDRAPLRAGRNTRSVAK